MKQSLSACLLAISLCLANTLPCQATTKQNTLQQFQPQIFWSSGRWCLKLPEIGLFCYVL